MSLIEDYIDYRFKPNKELQVDINSRMYYLGTHDRIATKLMFFTCGDSNVRLVTNSIQEMSYRILVPGGAHFCGFEAHGVGEIPYRNLLNDHTRHINETKIMSIENVTT